MANSLQTAGPLSSPSLGEKKVLNVTDLKVHFRSSKFSWRGLETTTIRAVDGVSLFVGEGETLGIVGESGCGKSTLARAIVGLCPPTSGEIRLLGQRVDRLNSQEFLPYRSVVQMIFQDPMSSLNPRMSAGTIIMEPMQNLGIHARSDRLYEALRLMARVGLNPRHVNRYPHEFSGGQRQRIGVARALAAQPKVILCDEPVSALDVSIQAQVVNLLRDLQDSLGIAYLFISHDLAIVRHISHRVGVMYLGRIVELGETSKLFENPRHPYTQMLLSAAPVPDPIAERTRQRIIPKGEPPSPDRAFVGCRFAERCPLVENRCRRDDPQLEGMSHFAACFQAAAER